MTGITQEIAERREERKMSGREFQTGYEKNITLAYIRSELREHRYTGNLFEALEFLLSEYDKLMISYQVIAPNIREFDVSN